MGSHLRYAIAKQLKQLTGRNNVYYKLECPAKNSQVQPVLSLSLESADGAVGKEQITDCLRSENGLIKSVDIDQSAWRKGSLKVDLQLNQQAYVESLLSTLPAKRPSQRERLVFEFSSPNIAKPFHVGHLRSTIIGNTLARLHQQLGYQVTTLNYLGDWGTQFGMLQVGVDLLNITDEQMQNAPIEMLYKAYVAANKASQSDESVSERARRVFSELEDGLNQNLSKQWQKYRQYTIIELTQIYERLGVRFERYEWESQYSQQHISSVLEQLTRKQLMLDESDGRKVVSVDGRRVPLIKSDGSTLYLARDIAALLDRLQRFQFDGIYYVVDNAQTDHFNAVFKTSAALTENLLLDRMKHVKFGRVLGMSTRKGQVVFLKDILDEARTIMREKQMLSATTKVNLGATDFTDPEDTSDILGVSAVIVNDLKQRRQRDYQFDWQKALQVNGDTGIKLQYTHCRLHSLLANMQHIDLEHAKPDCQHLTEPEALALLYELARYEQLLWQAKEQLEPCVLVNYLFGLCNATSRALKRLNVKNEKFLIKQQNRLLLFQAAKQMLHEGMSTLGLKPLNKM